MLNERRVVITGLGVISSIGIGKDTFWDSLQEGKSGISPITAFDTSCHFTHNGGQVKLFKPEEFIQGENLKFMNRATQMAVASAKLAVEDGALTFKKLSPLKVGVSHGTTLGAAQAIEEIDNSLIINREVSKDLFYQMPPHTTPAAIAREFGCNGPFSMFSTACAAGNYAIAYAYDLIRLSRADIMIAGASDGISRIEYTGFNQFSAVAPEKCQPFDKNRKGMIPGEAAGILVLESLENAVKRNVPIYAEILGYGLSCDAHHMTNASVAGITECMKKAIRESGITLDDVDYISAHGTGTQANDRAECAAIQELFGTHYSKIPVSSIKSMLGHTMGAASALEAIACALVVKNDIIPPTINFETADPECNIDCVPNRAREHRVIIALNNSYAFGGNNICLVISKFKTTN
jgi:3-oxoacyl-[acyl-carrier-protein] synthase II